MKHKMSKRNFYFKSFIWWSPCLGVHDRLIGMNIPHFRTYIQTVITKAMKQSW